jgi:hypothetical protein
MISAHQDSPRDIPPGICLSPKLAAIYKRYERGSPFWRIIGVIALLVLFIAGVDIMSGP